MESQQSLHPETKDELLTLLADHHRRATLAYFQKSADDVASVDELSAELTREDYGDEDVTTRLHHSVLPKLDAAGVVDYDGRSNTVRYRGHAKLETMVEFVADF